MSKPMNTAQRVAQAKKWGYKLNVIGNPDAHHRPGAWGDVKGSVIHHFGSVTSDAADRRVIQYGHSTLPGPLSQTFLGDDNEVDLISTGRCNHAGKGSSRTLALVKSEGYSGVITPGPDDTDGNAWFYGDEVGYSGTEWMGDERYKVLLLEQASICDFHGWSAKSVIAHYEWTRRKWDPGFRGARYDMAKVRRDIQILLDRGPSTAPKTVATAKVPVLPTPQPGPWAPAGVDTRKPFGWRSVTAHKADVGVYAPASAPLSVAAFQAALKAGIAGKTGQRHGAEKEVWAVEQALYRWGKLDGRYATDRSAGSATRDALAQYTRYGHQAWALNQLMWDTGIKAVWK